MNSTEQDFLWARAAVRALLVKLIAQAMTGDPL
jgi:hypothetical protein